MRYCLLLLLALTFCGCKNDAPAAEELLPNGKKKLTNEEKLAMMAPPPPECGALTQEEVQAILPVDVTFPLPGQRSVTSFYSCQYDIDGSNWSSQLIIEFPKKPNGRQTVIDKVAGAKAGEELTIKGNSARIVDDNTIYVAGAKPLMIKYTAVSRNATTQVWKPEEVRGFLQKFAEAAL
ncbi:hypothetical protein [Lewinella sp. 4G2]|uniref:hypothetical protein n=1 Tax=Lewinella sp. 4G2 TaxID=1803372 RepID=UPI0007B4DF73|nr:hypothetical protein [Lewinella sp. 4G2]OAV42608.1 hypothetical protein A3850_015285 [Lewinella sp. 4G2]